MRSHFAHFTCCWPDTPLCHHLSSDCECKFSGYILVPSRLFQVFSGFPGTKVDWPDTFLCHHSSSSCCRLQMPVLPIYFGPTSTISGFKGSTSVFSFRVEQVCTFHLLTLLCATIHHNAAGCTFSRYLYPNPTISESTFCVQVRECIILDCFTRFYRSLSETLTSLYSRFDLSLKPATFLACFR